VKKERGGERSGEGRGEGGGARKELSLHSRSGTYSIMSSVNSNVGGRGFWMFQTKPRAHSGESEAWNVLYDEGSAHSEAAPNGKGVSAVSLCCVEIPCKV
jgi:hypothetical protein